MTYINSPSRVVVKPGELLPPDTIFVGDSTAWGNPWGTGGRKGLLTEYTGFQLVLSIVYAATPEDAFKLYEKRFLDFQRTGLISPDSLLALRAHHLACTCPLTHPDGSPFPCHADFLLQVANADSVLTRHPFLKFS